LCSRVSHAAIAWYQGRRLSAYYVPLQILSDWTAAVTKIWILFHPSKQNWLNRGARTLDTTRGSAFFALRTGFAHYLYGFSCAALIALVGMFVGFLPLLREAPLFLNFRPKPKAPAHVRLVSPDNAPGGFQIISPSPQRGLQTADMPLEVLILKPWMAMQSMNTDGGSIPTKLLEPLLYERPRH
jgi:hypothetical protein